MDIGNVVAGMCVECLLCIAAYIDIRNKMLPVALLAGAGILGVPVYLASRQFGLVSLCAGVAVGVAMFVVSYLTHGGIGIGDGGVLCVTGVYLGFYRNIIMFLTALILAAVWSVILLITKRAGRKTEIPFVPFLLVAHTVLLFGM